VNQDQPSPDRAVMWPMLEKWALAYYMEDHVVGYQQQYKAAKDLEEATDAILAMLDERTRATNIRQIENWRDWIERREDLQWLVKDMNEAIAALKDATQTDANGIWLGALSKGADKDE
jgi:methionine synthase II (cobalamin-independent)